MSTETTVPLIQVQVTFDLSQTPPLQVGDDVIEMPAGLAVVEFKLEGDASFLSAPLQWMQNESALDLVPPPFMRAARLDATTVVVTSDNRSPSGQSRAYSYLLLVFSDGKVYATDPTIINVTPGSGG